MYCCEYCNYSTDIHSNYKKHYNTKKHIKNFQHKNHPPLLHTNPHITKVNIPTNIYTKKTIKEPPSTTINFKCDFCTLTFSRKDSLIRHTNKCCHKKIQELQHKINYLENKLKEKDKISKYTIKTIKETVNKAIDSNNKAIDTVKESVKKGNKSVYNIVINQIKKPLPLEQVEDVKQIHSAYRDDEIGEFVRDLCSMQQNGSLYKFIGNFIIKKFKKNDIMDQSLFSTDSSRSNFIYSALDKDNNVVWKKDPKGLKVGSITLDSVLIYIQDIIGKEQLKIVKSLGKLNEYEVLKLSDIISTCNKIDRRIRHNNELKNKIVAYLSANFGFDERDLLLNNA